MCGHSWRERRRGRRSEPLYIHEYIFIFDEIGSEGEKVKEI